MSKKKTSLTSLNSHESVQPVRHLDSDTDLLLGDNNESNNAIVRSPIRFRVCEKFVLFL